VEKKIRTLFKYRKLPYLLSYLDKKDARRLKSDLITLQVAIYELDHYLETNWKLSNNKLKSYWKGIYRALGNIGIDLNVAFEMTNHIRRYQRHEEQLRDGMMPTLINKEFYYYYKSCDVRLMREIIYKINPSITKDCTLEDWRYFDIITEINDDIEDVFEDQKTINGNMFLIQVIEDGLGITIKDFERFISEILTKENARHLASDSNSSKKLNKATIKEANQTLRLLHANAKKLERKSIRRQMPLVAQKILKLGS